MAEKGQKPKRKFAKDFLEKWARAERQERPVEEALREVEDALRASDASAGLWFRKGVILSELGRWELALESLRKAESLDPTVPRLHDVTSFVLDGLAREGEVKEAVEHAPSPPPATDEASVEEALEFLADELKVEAEEEAAQTKAVEDLEDLTPLAKPEEVDETRIAQWEAAGYDVAPLRRLIRTEPDRARSAIFQFEQNVRKADVLRQTLGGVDPKGLEAEVERVRELLRSPYQTWRLEAEMETLLERAEARDAARRAQQVSPRATPPRRLPRGAINGRAVGRVNGRVNGVGRVNGLVNGVGRVNGLVNGLVNGVRRSRAGLTNGLTNGVGLTNGLAGPRFRAEARVRRWRLYLVPVAALLLLSVPMFAPVPIPRPLGGAVVDGDIGEWERVPAYSQNSTAANPDVDLLEYAMMWQDRRLSVRGAVSGEWFAHPTRIDLVHVFVDGDGDRSTGYDEGRVGADILIAVHGSGGLVLGSNAWSWSGADQDNWTAWQGLGATLAAAVEGSDLELQIDLTGVSQFDEDTAAIVVHTDDQEGARATSEVAFGRAYGALWVRQVAVASTIPPTAAATFVSLTFRAIGASVSVSGLDFDRGATTPVLLQSFLPLVVSPGLPRTVTLSVEARGLANGTLLTADLVGIAANRSVVISGSPVRSYVGQVPGGKIVDGVFTDWNGTSADPSRVANGDVDIERYVAEGANGTLSVYADVRGTSLGGAAILTARTHPTPGPSSAPSAGGVPARRVGDDVFRFLFDDDATGEGVRVGGMVADTVLEIRGRNGRVRSVEGFSWQLGWWTPIGTARAVASGDELEASLAFAGIDLGGAPYVVEARDWRGAGDLTTVDGVRGTRSSGGGTTFLRRYEATLPRSADGIVTFVAPGQASVSWTLPEFRVIHAHVETQLAQPGAFVGTLADSGATYRRSYAGIDAEIAYEAEASRLKESITLFAPPIVGVEDVLVIQTPIVAHDGLFADILGVPTPSGLLLDGDLVLTDGRGRSVVMLRPWAEDAYGRRVDLQFRWSDDALAVLVPGSWLAGAEYPVLVDPTTTYQFENDGPSQDVGENLGYTTALGDFNNDGYADLLTGAPVNNLDGNLHGYAYVFYGPLDAADATPDVRIRGTATNARHGWSVAAGKFNADGFWDALVASRSLDGAFTGNVSIYYGSSSWSGLEQTPDVNFTWPSVPKNFGNSVAAANIDNAGYDDVLIGEPGRDNDGGTLTSDGVVHAFMSPFSSPETTADFTLKPSTNTNGQFGSSIAVAKIDSDASADVLVGEPFASSNNGRVHFFKGSNMTSGSGDRLPDAVLSAQTSGEKFGFAVAAGTIDGDAYSDVLVGSPGKTVGGTANTGGAYVFLANSDGSGLTTGASPTATLSNQSSGEQFGSAVLVVDFDDDGSGGAFVGGPFSDTGGTDRGAAYWFDAPSSDQTVDETVSGTQNSELMGWSLAGARFGSDARTRVAIGAYRWDDNSANPSDNDGRVLIAEVPEPASLLVFAGIFVGLCVLSLKRRGLVRNR